ncbi:MAG TPA: DUF6282 family protein [Gammaproteobacteria bacterium]|jgi:hypothetical protein
MFRSTALALLALTSVPAWAQLEGVIDVHVHTAPDSRERSLDALEAARMARRYGMRAIVLKNHYTHTASLAYMVSQVVPDVAFYGGIALNRSVGGVNPIAVEHMALTTGRLGRVVWLPTFDSEHNHLTVAPNPDHVPIVRDGTLLPEVVRVLELIAEYDLSLATGHSSPAESLAVIRIARDIGVERIIVTHPGSPLVRMSAEEQRQAARLGALLEYPIGLALPPAELTLEMLAAQIREVGPESVVLSTDLGQVLRPVPADGLLGFIDGLLKAGFSQSEIDVMTRRNPARFLGLE